MVNNGKIKARGVKQEPKIESRKNYEKRMILFQNKVPSTEN